MWVSRSIRDAGSSRPRSSGRPDWRPSSPALICLIPLRDHAGLRELSGRAAFANLRGFAALSGLAEPICLAGHADPAGLIGLRELRDEGRRTRCRAVLHPSAPRGCAQRVRDEGPDRPAHRAPSIDAHQLVAGCPVNLEHPSTAHVDDEPCQFEEAHLHQAPELLQRHRPRAECQRSENCPLPRVSVAARRRGCAEGGLSGRWVIGSCMVTQNPSARSDRPDRAARSP
jgi:hypothetical protein